MNDNFKYDIAFSFCQEDENIAYEINDYLKDAHKVFIYSKRQNELVGSDGEIEFKRTFSEYSRVVVVLYREKYGTTTWTRIEEEAIRNRAYDEGYDFTIFIPLEENNAIPKYLPKTRIWYDYMRFGPQNAANIISFLVTERGGQAIKETPKEKAERIKRKIHFNDKLQNYLKSPDASIDANQEVENLFNICKEKANDIFNGLNFQITKDNLKFITIHHEKMLLTFRWSCYWSNSLENSKLEVTINKYRNSSDPFQSPTPYCIKKHQYDFEKNINWENIWRLKSNKSKSSYYKSNILFDLHVSEFLDFIEDEKPN
jgi:hypothetical protein